MKTKNIVMHKRILKLGMIIVFVLALFSFHRVSQVWAKYKSVLTMNEQAKVADFGVLTFLEYKADGSTLVSGTEAEVEIINVNPGENINKKITISFTENEVDVYVFFSVDADKWVLNSSNKNRLSVKNDTGDDILFWELNDNWNYLATESLSSTSNRYVYYAVAEAYTGLVDDVMSQINVNSFGFEDIYIFNNNEYSLAFDTYAISKPGATPEQAWEKVNG